MALDVLDSVVPAVWRVLGCGQDARTGGFGSGEMRVQVFDLHQYAIDDVGNLGPLPRSLAVLAMVLRALVVRSRCGQHDDSLARLELSVRQPAVVGHAPVGLDEPESLDQPVHGGVAVL